MSRAVLRQSFAPNAILGASFLPDDAIAPLVTDVGAVVRSNALAVISATTNDNTGTMFLVTTNSATPPTKLQVRTGLNEAGAAAVFAGNQAIGSTGVKTFNATGHTAQATHYGYVVHRDGAGNDSDVMPTGAFTMFRNGATAQYVLDNTGPVGENQAGLLHSLALLADPDDWLSYDILSGPTPPGGDFDPNPDGTFTYFGPDSASLVLQRYTNNTPEAEETTVYLYDQTLTSPGSVQVNIGGTGAISQTHELAGDDAEQVNQAEAAAITQVHLLAGANITQANNGSTGALGAITITLGGTNSTQANAGTTGEIEQAHKLAASPTTQTNTAQAGAITQVQILAGANATQTNEAWAAAITQTQILLAESAVQANLGAIGAITQIGIDDPLTPAEMRDLYNRVIALQAQLERVDNLTKLIPALL